MREIIATIKRLLAKPDESVRLERPSLEDLQSVGLTRLDFLRRYVFPVESCPRESAHEYQQRCLVRFYEDFPQLGEEIMRKRAE